jgi:hypothetical protein
MVRFVGGAAGGGEVGLEVQVLAARASTRHATQRSANSVGVIGVSL